jgi:hypothetical protein
VIAHVTVQGEGTKKVTRPAATFQNAPVLTMGHGRDRRQGSPRRDVQVLGRERQGEVKSAGFLGGPTSNETSVLLSFTK